MARKAREASRNANMRTAVEDLNPRETWKLAMAEEEASRQGNSLLEHTLVVMICGFQSQCF